MTREGRYPIAYAGAITASAAIIGPIIPPSIPMVLYALISDTSIGYLFLGGFVPGVMLGIWLQTRSSRDGATIRSSRRSRYAKSHALRYALSRR